MDVPWEGGGVRRASSLCAVVNADGDDGVGDERTVTAVRVEPFQTTPHDLHGGAAVGKRGHHGIDIDLIRAWYADQHVDDHLVSGGAHQPGKPETAVVAGVSTK